MTRMPTSRQLTATTRRRRPNNSAFVVVTTFLITLLFPVCSSWTNKVEGPIIPFVKLSTNVVAEQQTQRHSSSFLSNKQVPPKVEMFQNSKAILTHETQHGMPWKSSISNGRLSSSSLQQEQQQEPFFMPFWEWQLDYMKQTLTNLRPLPTTDPTGNHDLTYVEQLSKPKSNPEQKQKQKHASTTPSVVMKRMITICFESDEYRLIRMTLLDGGNQTQVFTSAWYPRGNIPIFGIDLLQFPLDAKQKKYLLDEQKDETWESHRRHVTIADFQPIHSKEDQHDALYEKLLRPIRDQYPTLQGAMTTRFFHPDDPFFSSQLLLGRESNPKYVWSDLFPAIQAYSKTHVTLAKQTMPSSSDSMTTSTTPLHILDRHVAYDNFSAERDPAYGLLKASFGEEFANQFVHGVLFPLSNPELAPRRHQSSSS